MFDPVAYINTPRWQLCKPGLSRMFELLEGLGNPQDSLHVVHVAGTNGKGSVCAFTSSIFRAAGLRTGLFTSPFLYDFSERIQINGQAIDDRSLLEITLKVKKVADQMSEHPTEFELMCAVALCYFHQEQCDIVVLEVGLGGSLDATNIIKAPELSVITPISFDHESILGSTLTEIAGEKAGIIKQDAPVLSAPQDKEVLSVLQKRALRLNAPFELLSLEGLEIVSGATQQDLRWRFLYDATEYEISLLAPYQLQNACLAIRAAEILRQHGWPLTQDIIREGLARAYWPGRFEVVLKDPLVIFDGGHNAQGACELARSISSVFPDKKACFVLGVMQDKDVSAMVDALMPLASRWICCEPNYPRALDAETLEKAVQQAQLRYLGHPACADIRVARNYEEALMWAMNAQGDSELVVVCGSLYALGEAHAALQAVKSKNLTFQQER